MDIMALILTFVIVWWIVLFMFLPFSNNQPGVNETGVEQPKMLWKISFTTIIAILLTLAFYYLTEKKIIDFEKYFFSENACFFQPQIKLS